QSPRPAGIIRRNQTFPSWPPQPETELLALSLHNERAMRRSAGFTMIEMMFVVVVIAVLAAVAVVAYTKTMNKSRLAEIPSMFGELKSREEAYKAEFGSYLTACTAPSGVTVGGFREDCDEGDYWPTPLAGKGNKTDASIPPARWQTLRVQIPSAGLYCQYEVVAGPANDDTTIGTTGQKIFLDTAGA